MIALLREDGHRRIEQLLAPRGSGQSASRLVNHRANGAMFLGASGASRHRKVPFMGAARIDWESEGLLEGLDDKARVPRIALLEQLSAAGAGLDELRTAVMDGRLSALPSELAVSGRERWTAREAALEAGLDLDVLLALRRANGAPIDDPDLPVIRESDLAAARLSVALMHAGVGLDQILATSRVMGRALAHVADAMASVMFSLAYDPDLDEAQLAAAFLEQATVLGPFIGPVLDLSVQIHMRDALRTAAIAATERSLDGSLPGASEVSVAFADLVGFTRMGEEMPAEALNGVAERLETLVAEVVRPPVRFVKSIGDAAMLISPETDALLQTVLDLVDATDAEAETMPQVRVGVARGRAAHRGGDWFGQPVNLASRITGVARAGSVLASRGVRDAASADIAWSRAGERELRGVPDRVALYRARRPAVGDPSTAGD